MSTWLRRVLRRAADNTVELDVPPMRVRDAETLCARARVALSGQRFTEAIENLEAALDIHADSTTHRLLAQARSASGDTEGAIDELYLAVELASDDAEARVELAEHLMIADRRDEASVTCAGAIPAASAPELHLRFARCLKQLARYADAAVYYQNALRQVPDDAAILGSLGLAQAKSGDWAGAEASYARALEIDPTCLEALHNLALLRREQGALDAARELFERALALRPDSVETQAALAHALRDLGYMDEALALYGTVLQRRPDSTDALLNRSFALLMGGRLAEGWDAYERRLGFREPPVKVPARAQLWAGESGVIVHVAGEQGLGDQIMFASCLPDLLRSAGSLSMSCDSRLRELFRRAFPAIDLGVRQQPAAPGARWVALGSLPRYFRKCLEDFPGAARYLQADARSVARWRRRLDALGSAPRIGLSWRGGTLRSRGFLRSIPADILGAKLRPVRAATWVSLQYGRVDEDVRLLRETLGLVHWTEIEDLDQCAALVEALDLVVTVDTTIAHLAGALGQRAWILLPQTPEWRWSLGSETTVAWYPSARLFRQRTAADWSDALDAVAREVAHELEEFGAGT